MPDVNIQEVIANLLPRTDGFNLVYDIFLYIIFVLNLILMFGQSDKQTIPTIFAGGAAALAVIAKLDVFTPKTFGSLIVNAGMFVLPLIVVGISRAKKVQPLGVISGVLAAIYFFMFWFFSQRS
ncbi:MAG: hypothetical protein LCI00_00660 [Chloroflexi bacterium]|nr:hypothetical protein [Chloroflexota bacterium]MCC6896941.1 hypothetical protein [Anaerolineae bacterium]